MNITRLDSSHKNLQTIPKEIGLLTTLQTLILSNNKLRTIPKELGQLKLQQLILDTNLKDLIKMNNGLKIIYI